MVIDLTSSVDDNQIFKIDLTSTPNIQYYGYAPAGTKDTDPFWKLYILDLDANGVPVGKRFALGSPAYIHIYANRTSIASFS